MAETIGEADIEVGAVDDTADDLQRIQRRLERTLQAAGKSSGDKLVKELRRAADTAGDRMVRELQDDFKIIENQLNELSEERKIKLQAELEATAARAELMYEARDRIVNLWAVVRGNAAAELAALTKGLSGLSAIQGWKDTIVAFGSSLPQTTMRLGLLGGALTSLINPIMSMLTTIAPLGADLGKLGGLVNALPAYAGAAAAGVAVLVMAFKNLQDASTAAGQQMYSTLQNIKSSFSELQKTVQGNFAEGFAAPFDRLANVVLPQLSSGLSRVATALGQQWGAVADRLSTVLDGNALEPFFSNLENGIKAATPGFASIAEALSTIAIKGSGTFESLGEWISKIGEQFRGWADGADIEGIINRGVNALMQLWEVGTQAWRVVEGIFTAMDTGKSTGLDSLAGTLSKIADVVQGAGFQNAMGTVFTGASEGASALAAALTPIGESFERLAPTISNLLSTMGGAFATALTNIMEALSSPVAQGGLNAAIEGLSGLLTGIDWAGFAPIIGAIGGVVQTVAENMTNLVNSILPYIPGIIAGFQGFAGTIGAILPGIVGFVGPLLQIPGVVEGILIAFTAWKTIGPIISAVSAAMGIATAVQAGFAAAVSGATLAENASKASKIGYIATLAAQKVAMVASTVATQASAAAQWLLNAALTANPIGIVIAAITALVASLIWFFTQTELGQEIWANFTKFLGETWDNVVKFVQDTVNNLVSFFTDSWNNISNGVTEAFTAIGSFFQTIWNSIVDWVVSAVVKLISFYLDSWNNITNGVRTAFTAIYTFFQTIWNDIINWIVQALARLTVFFSDAWNNIASTINSIWNGILDFFRGIGSKIIAAFSGAVNWLVQSGSDIINGLFRGIQDFWNNVVSFFRGLPGTIGGFFAGAGNWLWNAGRDLINGLLDGISSLAGSIGSFFLNLLPGWIVGPFKAALGISSPSKLFTTFGEYIGDGLVNGLNSSESAITSATESMASSTSKLFDGLREQVAESNETLNGLNSKQLELAALRGKLDSEGDSLGASVSDTLYQAGVDAGSGIVKGLKSQIDVIEGMMREVADGLVTAVEDRLGAQSTATGLIRGVSDMSSTAQLSLARRVNPTQIRPVSGVSTTAGSSTTSTTTQTYTVAPGAIQVLGSNDPERTAQETVDRMMERLGA